MKSLFNTILFLSLISSSSCSAQDSTQVVPPVVPVDTKVDNSAPAMVWKTVTSCVYKYDSKYNIDFYPENKSEKHPTYLPELTVYYIIDVKGMHWIVNQYDMENYTCRNSQVQRKL